MGLSVMQNFSGHQEIIFSLFRGPQLNSRKKSQKIIEFYYITPITPISPRWANGWLGSSGLLLCRGLVLVLPCHLEQQLSADGWAAPARLYHIFTIGIYDRTCKNVDFDRDCPHFFSGHFVPVLKSQHRTKRKLLISYRVLPSTLWDRSAAKVGEDPPVQRAKRTLS